MSEVKIWNEIISIPTYGVGQPNKNPMFLEKRVYQGSSGRVYPLPVIDTIENTSRPVDHDVVFLENNYLKIMVMPSLGGRVQMAYDKTNDFHFIYYNQVIKPALVGLVGPWISGGIEFNWPQHHRPGTYMPVDHTITDNADGSKTLWVSEIERMYGTRALTGFTLYPGKAYLEVKVRLYNRTTVPQTFLWWANPAMAVNDDYQSIFPPDVHAVFDHGKRDVSSFPIATGTYYKMDYSAGVDISRFKNIPVPTSFMAAGSRYDFMGGYDHGRRAGMLHFADHHVSCGKKQWVWGSGDFGNAWHRNLTDADGPYVELMTGVFTDNQPDFSWLMPYEEKSFTQYFFPYKHIGAVKNANPQAAVNLELGQDKANIGVYVTSEQQGLKVILSDNREIYYQETIDLDPTHALLKTIDLPGNAKPHSLILEVYTADGRLMVSFRPEADTDQKLPQPAQAIDEPHKLPDTEALYLAGLHLEQYRHATRRAVDYYQEALRRNSSDLRCNNAMGLLLYRQGQFAQARQHFQTAIDQATRHNPNPYDGEPYYNLGLTLVMLEELEPAYDAFYKATWNAHWQDPAFFALAQLSARQNNLKQALEHVNKALDRNYRSSKARHLKTILLRLMNQLTLAENEAQLALTLDPLDFGALFELYQIARARSDSQKADILLKQFQEKIRGYVHNYIEIALDYSDAGFTQSSAELLKLFIADCPTPESVYPLVYYHLAAWGLSEYLPLAARASSDYCFPHRLSDLKALQYAVENNPTDAKAWYYLGNFWYSKQQYDHAIEAWEKSAKLDNSFPTVHRNLGLASFNKQHDAATARLHYEKAFALDPTDARVLFELDQLYKKTACLPGYRRKFLQQNQALLEQRDDLYVEYIWLLNLTGDYELALNLLGDHYFHPWEGGEGKVTGAYVFALTQLAHDYIVQGDYHQALTTLARTLSYPENLGEGKLLGCRENDIHYYTALAYAALGQQQEAHTYFELATAGSIIPADAMFYNDQPPEKIYYQGLAYAHLGNQVQAEDCFSQLLRYGRENIDNQVQIDYFAVSLPDFLVFDEDLALRNTIHCRYLMGLGYLGLGHNEAALAEFNAVLNLNPAHAGALIHKKLL